MIPNPLHSTEQLEHLDRIRHGHPTLIPKDQALRDARVQDQTAPG